MPPNAQRHKPNWAKRPPAAGPVTVATPHMADTSAERGSTVTGAERY